MHPRPLCLQGKSSGRCRAPVQRNREYEKGNGLSDNLDPDNISTAKGDVNIAMRPLLAFSIHDPAQRCGLRSGCDHAVLAAADGWRECRA